MTHSAEFRRCLIDLDVPGVRRLWQHVAPHLPQPKTADETLNTMHLARSKMQTLPVEMRAYSEKWLAERRTGRIALAVGIAVKAPPHRMSEALAKRHAMSEAVLGAVRDGVRLDTEAHEVTRRMKLARARA